MHHVIILRAPYHHSTFTMQSLYVYHVITLRAPTRVCIWCLRTYFSARLYSGDSSIAPGSSLMNVMLRGRQPSNQIPARFPPIRYQHKFVQSDSCINSRILSLLNIRHYHLGLSQGFKPKGHVTHSHAALRVKYKGMRFKNTIFQNLGVKIFLKQIFSSIFTISLI
jgi:hypothetical protein